MRHRRTAASYNWRPSRRGVSAAIRVSHMRTAVAIAHWCIRFVRGMPTRKATHSLVGLARVGLVDVIADVATGGAATGLEVGLDAGLAAATDAAVDATADVTADVTADATATVTRSSSSFLVRGVTTGVNRLAATVGDLGGRAACDCGCRVRYECRSPHNALQGRLFEASDANQGSDASCRVARPSVDRQSHTGAHRSVRSATIRIRRYQGRN